jgi:hypothetical protein
MFKKILVSLPIQLLLLNLKRNRLILLIWILFFAMVLGKFGSSYGVHYLFLDPEYLGEVNFWSFFSVGMAFGVFCMSYSITIYILESDRFQFLMIKNDPFSKFCLNNIAIIGLFVIVYFGSLTVFQLDQGEQQLWSIIKEISGFLVGTCLTFVLTFLYFKITGYAIFRNFTDRLNSSISTKSRIYKTSVMDKIRHSKQKNYHVEYYLDYPCIVRKVEHFVPFEKNLVSKVIDHNHINAFLYQLTGFLLLLLMGHLGDNPYFQLPAGASIFLLGSIIIMLFGAFSFWLKGWAPYVLVAILVGINFAMKIDLIDTDFQVFGLNYNAKPATYSAQRVMELSNEANYKNDYAHTIAILENWKAKFPATTKPKMILICTSGGGQRAAIWTIRTLQVSDSILNGGLLKNTFCITGASGGLIGASYYRELYLRKQLGQDIDLHDKKYFYNMTKDMLNPVVFSFIINDLFFRTERFTDGKYEYIKDRGHAFEAQLDKNTEGMMRKKVMDYKIYEDKAIIPMLLLTPSLVNDSRKLYISPQPISYMNGMDISHSELFDAKVNGVEFMRFFKDQDAKNLGFLSGLRMSATFPYITPNINLPSTPRMEVMDAGLIDNFGIVDAVRFAFIFREWIHENTSGVVFMCIRDSPKLIPVDEKAKTSLLDRILNPIATLYNNWDWIQDHNNDYFLEYAKNFLKDMDVVEFQYSPITLVRDTSLKSKNELDKLLVRTWKERASLNWHLTKKEKNSLHETIYTDANLRSLHNLKKLLIANKSTK